jgi:RNA polymerase sigma-70 factor (ECF subfamily)
MPVPPDEQALLDLLRAGDESAAQQIFTAYVNRLLSLARTRISQRLARRIDPEDIVQSAFRTFFSRVKAGHFTFEEHDDLGKILVSITIRKTLRQVAFHRAAKRDSGLEEDPRDASGDGLLELSDLAPSPEATVAFLDQLDHFLARLRSQDRPILEMRLQGYRNEEIARELGTSDRHVRRVLEHIRAVAEQEELAP